MPDHAKLLVCEKVVPPGNEASVTKIMDLVMLVLTDGGRERTELEFRDLFARAGLPIAYGPVQMDMYRNAAALVAKILDGTPPAGLPIERPLRYELVINLKAAQALGLTVPQSLLQRADEVIQ